MWGGYGWASERADPRLLSMLFSKEGGHTQGYTQGGQCWKYTSHGNFLLFIVCQVALFGVSDHCVKKDKYLPVPVNICKFKVLLTGFHIMHWMCNIDRIQVPPLGCACCQFCQCGGALYLDIIRFGYLASDIMDDMKLFLRCHRRELKRGDEPVCEG